MDVPTLEARLLGNGEVREEFKEDDHYIGPTSNCSPPSFRVAVSCHEGEMVILRPRDETC